MSESTIDFNPAVRNLSGVLNSEEGSIYHSSGEDRKQIQQSIRSLNDSLLIINKRSDESRNKCIPLVPRLCELLDPINSKSWYSRHTAADIIAHIGPHAKEAEASLLKALTDVNNMVVSSACKALSGIGSTSIEVIEAVEKACFKN